MGYKVKNKIIVVEGRSDASFLKYLFNEMGFEVSENIYSSAPNNQNPTRIMENIYITNLGGYNSENPDKLKENLEKLLNRPENFEKIIYLLDADKNFSKVEKRIKDLNNDKVSYFIFPDNENVGMLENILINIAKKKNLMKFIGEDIFEKLNEHKDSEIKKEAKSKVMIYLASNTPLKESLQDALQAKELWDFKSRYLDKIKSFLLKELELKNYK